MSREYFLRRAQEEISLAEQLTGADFHSSLNKAIQILLLARANETLQSKKPR